MKRNQKEITLELALKAAIEIIEQAKKDGGEPIAITIVGVNPNVPIVTLAMDGVLPISAKLCWQKAYTAIMTKVDTIYWARWQEKGKSMINFCDPDITGFAGGVVIYNPFDPKGIEIIGAVGVSGRSGYRKPEDKLPQDHELAQYGAVTLQKMLISTRSKTAH